jgi:hypothetical protein
MRKRPLLLAVACLSLLMAGCGTLIPKKVELGQDKVEKFPTPKWREQEVQKQAAQRAKDRAGEVLVAAVKNASPPEVTLPAAEAAEITDAVADVLGPPESRSVDPTPVLADKTRASVAKQDGRVVAFQKENDHNIGKKIEGTGFIQISYFAWVGGFLVLLVLGYVAVKVISVVGSAMNPTVGLGMNAVSLGVKGATKALSQVIKGGQNFKAMLDQSLPDQATKDAVLKLFKVAQDKAQDEEVQLAVKHLTKS